MGLISYLHHPPHYQTASQVEVIQSTKISRRSGGMSAYIAYGAKMSNKEMNSQNYFGLRKVCFHINIFKKASKIE